MTAGHHSVGKALYGGRNVGTRPRYCSRVRPGLSWPLQSAIWWQSSEVSTAPGPRRSPETNFFSQKWAPSHQASSTSRYLRQADPLICCHPEAAILWEPQLGEVGGGAERRESLLSPGCGSEHTWTRQGREGGLIEEWIWVT